MDGMPLYEYARKGIPLPRPIEPRKVTVHSLELVEWKGIDHKFRWPEKSLSDSEKKAMDIALQGASESVSVTNDIEPIAEDQVPVAFVLKMKVSGGTYVRSIVHDLAHAVGSAGHVVSLTRSRQGRFVLNPTEEGDRSCVPWEVFQRAIVDSGGTDNDGWTEWEREVIERLEVVEPNRYGTA
jgi:tRNA pseudouridine55 synthase